MENQQTPQQAISDIHRMMDRSTKFLSLSGWSGIWAGSTALAGAAIAWYYISRNGRNLFFDPTPLMLLGIAVLTVALLGGLYFTKRKASKQGLSMWTVASKQMMVQIAFPLAIGGFVAAAMLYYQQPQFVAPFCLIFYGVALINGGRYTVGDIRTLGLLQVVLGCINMFMPWKGLLFFTIGFGVLHILYGILMWRKYDRKNDEIEIAD